MHFLWQQKPASFYQVREVDIMCIFTTQNREIKALPNLKPPLEFSSGQHYYHLRHLRLALISQTSEKS
jgi:hypothetical protein